jgi:hypothetical protein
MALHGEQNRFASLFPRHGLGQQFDNWTAFEPIVAGALT